MAKLIIVLTCFCVIPLVHSEYRYRMRGPVMHHRPPPPMPHKSNWPMTHRSHVRSPQRPPMPVQGPFRKSHVPMMTKPRKPPPVVIFPSTLWKTATNDLQLSTHYPYQFSSAVAPVTPRYEVPVAKLPPIKALPIKQIGERGPIHTIPAPNLSLADKPAALSNEIPPAQSYQNQFLDNTIINQKAHIQVNGGFAGEKKHVRLDGTVFGQHKGPSFQNHQYQVTEATDSFPAEHSPAINYPVKHSFFAPDPGAIQKVPNIFDKQLSVTRDDYFSTVPLSAKDLYQYMGIVPQSSTPQIQIQQSQTIPVQNYRPVLNNQQVVQPEQNSIQQFMQNFHPQYQTFNYEEPSMKNFNYQQSNVHAKYSLEPDVSASEIVNTVAVQNPNDALMQAQYIQNYFNTDQTTANALRQETLHPNSVQPETKIAPMTYYSSLPNRQAAEALATLQAAGSVTSDLMKIAQKKNDEKQEPMRIYVPDENETDSNEAAENLEYGSRIHGRHEILKKSDDYDDYTHESGGSSNYEASEQEHDEQNDKVDAKSKEK